MRRQKVSPRGGFFLFAVCFEKAAEKMAVDTPARESVKLKTNQNTCMRKACSENENGGLLNE